MCSSWLTSSATGERRLSKDRLIWTPCTFGQQIAFSCPFDQWAARPEKWVQRYFVVAVVQVLGLFDRDGSFVFFQSSTSNLRDFRPLSAFVGAYFLESDLLSFRVVLLVIGDWHTLTSETSRSGLSLSGVSQRVALSSRPCSLLHLLTANRVGAAL